MRTNTGSRSLHDEAGFSLGELLVVCAVTAVISAAAMPRVLGFQEGSRAVAAAKYLRPACKRRAWRR